MSKRPNNNPPFDEVDTAAGELRKPQDRADQPGQGANPNPPTPERLRPAGESDALDPARLETDPPRV